MKKGLKEKGKKEILNILIFKEKKEER